MDQKENSYTVISSKRVLIVIVFLPLSCCCCTAAAKLGCAPPRLETLDDANPVIDELKLVDVPDDIT